MREGKPLGERLRVAFGDLLARSKSRLFRKYAATLVALVGAALVVNAIVEAYTSYRENRDAISAVQREKALAASQIIEQYLKEIEGQLGWTTHASILSGPVGGEQRRFDFLRLLRQAPAITEVTFLDADGKEQLKVSRLSMDVAASGADRSGETPFKVARDNRRYVSPVYFRKESEPYLTLAIAGQSRRSGVTLAEVNLKFIYDVISRLKVGKGGLAYAVDDKGLLIAHPDIGLVLRKTDLSGLVQVKEVLLAGKDALLDPIASVAKDRSGRDVLTASATVATLGWTVFVEQPLSEAFEPIYDSLKRSGLVLLTGLGLAALAGLWLAQRMVVPIEALAAGAAKIGTGDLDHRIVVKTGDEVEKLADSFNAMGGQLKAYYAGLERKVEERTAELNESLKQQTASAEVLRVISSAPGNVGPVFEKILSSARELCEAEYGHLLMFDGQHWKAAALHNLPEAYAEFWRKAPFAAGPETLLGRIAKTAAPFQLDDARLGDGYRMRGPLALATVELGGARTLFGVPLLKDGLVIGAIVLYRQEVRPFTGKQVELLQTFADQAVIAIENARLFEEVQARTADLTEALTQQTAISDVLSVISKSPGNLEPVFQAMLENAVRVCDAKFGTLFRYDGKLLHLAASVGTPAPLVEHQRQRGSYTPVPGTAHARAIETKRFAHVVDALAEANPGNAARLGGARSQVIVPMLRDDQLAGTIVIYRQEVRPFTDKQVELLSSFAQQAVIAIENARLFDAEQTRTKELTRSVAEMKALSEVGQAVSSSLELKTVLGTILAHACEISATSAGAVYVLDDDAGELLLEAGHNMSEELIAAVRQHRIRLNDPVVGECAATGMPKQLPDLETRRDHPLFEVLRKSGVRAMLAVPLKHQDKTIGVLLVRRSYAGEFAPETILLLQSFASQSSIAINNARLFREIEEKGEQLRVASLHKSQFLANMSHELRTPLNAILGYTELIQDGVYGEPQPKVKSVLDRVQTNGKHLLGLINDVLDLSKIEAGQLVLKLDPYSLADVVHTVVTATESLAAGKKLKLATEIARELPVGKGDERRLTQVILNLVGNAIKFTDAGSVRITARHRGKKFTVKVIDTGPGIPPAEHAKIFEEFHQVDSSNTKKKGGTGLGLAISKRIVELHGGRISVESEVGKGSTFRIDMPVSVDKQRGV